MAAEYVQPVPCVWFVSVRSASRIRKPLELSSTSVALPTRCPPFTNTALQPNDKIRSAARFMASMESTVNPANEEASCRLGVTNAAQGSSCRTSASRASSAIKEAPCLEIITGSTINGINGCLLQTCATVSMMAAFPSAPVLAAWAGISSNTASNCSRTNAGSRQSTRLTLTVF